MGKRLAWLQIGAIAIAATACSDDGSGGVDAITDGATGMSGSGDSRSSEHDSGSTDRGGIWDAAGDSGEASGDGGMAEPPPPPNDLDPGDGTQSTGATIVLDGRQAETNGGQTGCSAGNDNLYRVQFSTVFPGPSILYVFVSLPADRLTGTRTFDVGPRPEDGDWTQLDQATMFVFGRAIDPSQNAAEGEVWVDASEGRVVVRFQDIVLRDSDGTEPSGHVISAAYRCDEPL